MTIHRRAQGWLDEVFHLQFRERLTHAAFRNRLAIPIYCLMPDHLHLLAIGYGVDSDQREAIAFLRRHLNLLLASRAGCRLQRQSYDHVLDDEDERQTDSFQEIAGYIGGNPLRAGLVPDVGALPSYPYLGCLLPGYPEVSLWSEDYWKRFWRIYAYLGQHGVP